MIFIILLSSLLFSFSVNAQLKSISSLRTFKYGSQTVSGYYTPNDGGGGFFYYDDTARADDNGGTVLRPISVPVKSPGRWKRVFDREINALWFGAKRDGSVDACGAITRAITAASQVNNPGGDFGYIGRGTVYIPGGNYRMDSTLKINVQVSVIGDPGFNIAAETKFSYVGNTRGIEIIRGNGGGPITIKNLWIRNFGTATDSTACGIWTNAKFDFYNVNVDNFGGNGFEINTLTKFGVGNSNNSIMMNCSASSNNLNGIYFIGGESNNIGIYSSDFTGNGQCGVLDYSFLGNSYVNCHVSDNGRRDVSNNKVWTRKGGNFYQSIYFDWTTNRSSHQGVEPGVTSGWDRYWSLIQINTVWSLADTSIIASWHKDSTYYITGAYVVVGPTSYTTLTACYSEGGQGATILNANSMAIGGDHGAGFANPGFPFFRADQYEFRVSARGLYLPDQDGSQTIHGFDNQFGLMLTSRKPGHYGLQAKYFESDRMTKFFNINSEANTVFEFIGYGHSGSRFGLNRNVNAGVHFPANGFFIADHANLANYSRLIFASTEQPRSEEHAAGEFCIYIGTNPKILGWRCVESGTPGKWVLIKSGN